MTQLTDKQKLDWKQQLKDACITVLEDRIKAAEKAMHTAQEASIAEGKSTAGDKHETSRAMAHLESEMNARQLRQAKLELAALLALNTTTLYTQVTNGAVVVCKEQTYFIALGLGPTVINEQKITLLSPQAPIAVLFHHKKAGDSVVFNGKSLDVVDVF